MVGLGEEIVYLTCELGERRESTLPIPRSFVGRPFIMVLAGPGIDELEQFYERHFGVAKIPQFSMPIPRIAEAQGPEGRFGESRLREELGGATNVALATQRLEAALHSFTGGTLDDDVAILALERSVGEAPLVAADMALDDRRMGLVESLYDSFNRRDRAGIVAVCDERMEFFPSGTAEAIGRGAPYVGPDGLQEYLADVAQTWEELLITPNELERRGERLLVRGRVYARSREHGIRDVPIAWVWEVRDGRFVHGEVFPDPERATERFSALITA